LFQENLNLTSLTQVVDKQVSSFIDLPLVGMVVSFADGFSGL